MADAKNDRMEKLIALCKRRGFIFAGSEIYGGLANSWDYGPLGAQLKKNIKDEWWRRFVERRSDMVGIDAALIMNPKVWEASGHLATFTDPLVECKKCHERFRLDKLIEDATKKALQVGYLDFMNEWVKVLIKKVQDSTRNAKIEKEKAIEELAKLRREILELGGDPDSITQKKEKSVYLRINFDEDIALDAELSLYDAIMQGGVGAYMEYLVSKKKIPCTNCDSRDLTHPQNFNLMLKTFLGPAEEKANVVYFRPETAQAMFVNFKNVLDTSRKRLPFGIAQIGKAFRNEITPGNFIFRTREFEQMEIEYFVRPEEWEQHFEYWLNEQKKWVKDLGVADEHVHYVEVPAADRAHYSKRSVDTEYEYPFGQKELYGLAYRSSYDLDSHMKASGADLQYLDPQTNEKFVPHVIEPTWGVDRSVLVALLEAYTEDIANERTYLKLPYWTAPYKVAVFPLLANKPALVEKARAVYDQLAKNFTVAWDDRGNVGKRYYAQDEIGTPFCVTVDFETLGEEGSDPAKIDTVTVRNRDTMTQDRVKISELQSYLADKLAKG